MLSYYQNEMAYAELVKRKRLYIQTGVCNSSQPDWHSLEDDISPSSVHSRFLCAVCGARFIWAAGHPEEAGSGGYHWTSQKANEKGPIARFLRAIGW